MKRRAFLKLSFCTITGSLVSFGGLPLQANEQKASKPLLFFFEVFENGNILFKLPVPEIGQGISEGLSLIVCEELGLSPAHLTLELSNFTLHEKPLPEGFDDGFSGGSVEDGAAGSMSVIRYWTPLRQAAANLRQLFIEAAANMWQLPYFSELKAQNSQILSADNQRSASFQTLVPYLTQKTSTEQAPLKSRKAYQLLGKTPSKSKKSLVTGQEVYSSDFSLPGTLYGICSRAKRLDAKLHSFNKTHLLKNTGVYDVIAIPGMLEDPTNILKDWTIGYSGILPGIAILAHSQWQAMSALNQLKVEWDTDNKPGKSTAELTKDLSNLSSHHQGDSNSNEQVISHRVVSHHQANMQMETLNSTAWVKGEYCEIWTSTQSPTYTANYVAKKLGLKPDNVKIHNFRAGGGFGRRYYFDFVTEAAYLSQQTGKPVKLVWTREDEVQNSRYQQCRIDSLQLELNPNGTIKNYQHHAATPAHEHMGVYGYWSLYDGGINDRKSSNHQLDYRLGLSGSWRSVNAYYFNWLMETAIDKLAKQQAMDPAELRLKLLKAPLIDDSERRREIAFRAQRVLKAVMNMSAWGTNTEKTKQGIAISRFGNTYSAQVATVEQVGDRFKISQIDCAFDCGLAIAPSKVTGQIEGSIIFALGTLLHKPIQFEQSAVVMSNFHDCSVPRMHEIPTINIQLIPSDYPPSGVGEPATAQTVPAVLNAINQLEEIDTGVIPFERIMT